MHGPGEKTRTKFRGWYQKGMRVHDNGRRWENTVQNESLPENSSGQNLFYAMTSPL